ncbi:hypothetical protein [Streptomyces sp. NRRL F-2580]|uniref:hypothetical protein n=1 Tax=Streptomyces sp. NRRL F-2580 TaxID=1463841 RepID=UPI0004C56F63|nr:hypothetical protein [Streptomyces sp. NRRL F-2580]
MGESGTDQILASKWDIPFVVFGMVRLAFGNLPLWAKAIVLGLVGSLAVWTGITWLRERRRAGRLSRSDRTG